MKLKELFIRIIVSNYNSFFLKKNYKRRKNLRVRNTINKLLMVLKKKQREYFLKEMVEI